jgi:hypothetical protein
VWMKTRISVVSIWMWEKWTASRFGGMEDMGDDEMGDFDDSDDEELEIYGGVFGEAEQGKSSLN